MIARPTTEQILLDCCRVLEGLLGAVTDETAHVRLVMLDKVLRNAATRSAHEIAWMLDEISAIAAYGQAVHAATGADSVGTALDHVTAGLTDSFHLDDVAQSYARASDLLSLSLEAALDAQHSGMIRHGESLLMTRLDRENQIVGGWDSAGR